jgi:hypothetical protein
MATPFLGTDNLLVAVLAIVVLVEFEDKITANISAAVPFQRRYKWPINLSTLTAD